MENFEDCGSIFAQSLKITDLVVACAYEESELYNSLNALAIREIFMLYLFKINNNF